MTPITLYSYFRSSASYRVRIALNLKNIPFEYKAVHLVKDGGQQLFDDFKALNPMAQIPCLKTSEGVFINQSMAILTYLDEIAPNPQLFPQESLKKAHVIEVCEIINSGIHPVQNLKVLKFVTQEQKFEKAEWAHYWIQEGFFGLEKRLSSISGDYCFGNVLTAADLFLVPQVYNARRFNVDLQQFPIIQKIEANCLKLEAFQKASPETQPDTEA